MTPFHFAWSSCACCSSSSAALAFSYAVWTSASWLSKSGLYDVPGCGTDTAGIERAAAYGSCCMDRGRCTGSLAAGAIQSFCRVLGASPHRSCFSARTASLCSRPARPRSVSPSTPSCGRDASIRSRFLNLGGRPAAAALAADESSGNWNDERAFCCMAGTALRCARIS